MLVKTKLPIQVLLQIRRGFANNRPYKVSDLVLNHLLF
jgi:hypothetical protein